MPKKEIIESEELVNALTEKDKQNIAELKSIYYEAGDVFKRWQMDTQPLNQKGQEAVHYFDLLGKKMKGFVADEPNLNIFPFDVSKMNQSEASRLVYKLRDANTQSNEFIYYIQRAYEQLFQFAFNNGDNNARQHWLVKTPVTEPFQNYALHKLPQIEQDLDNTVMCVMLRAALLPSLILGKEIAEYSNSQKSPPYALFKINRDENRSHSDMRYILDLDKSFFKLEDLDGKDLIFADPMNATGGSLITIIRYLLNNGVRPKSVKVFNVISAFAGALQTVRSYSFVKTYTLWMDPVLNEQAYILPGLGDAGDRLNGKDTDDPRNILRLMSHYGKHLTDLYSSELGMIEKAIFSS